jgi:hypothetical protein
MKKVHLMNLFSLLKHLAHLLNNLGSVHLAVTKSPLAIVLKIPSANE